MGLISRIRAHIARRKAVKKQRTFVWCKCGNEMVGDHGNDDKNRSFIRDVYVNDRNVVHYRCSKCGTDCYFDFDFPAPMPIPLWTEDTILDDYNRIYK